MYTCTPNDDFINSLMVTQLDHAAQTCNHFVPPLAKLSTLCYSIYYSKIIHTPVKCMCVSRDYKSNAFCIHWGKINIVIKTAVNDTLYYRLKHVVPALMNDLKMSELHNPDQYCIIRLVCRYQVYSKFNNTTHHCV